MINAINIVIDEKRPMQIGAEFIEIETDEGKPICIGERIPDGNFTKIRITAEDVIKATAKQHFKKLVDKHKDEFCKTKMFGVPISELGIESLRACICVLGNKDSRSFY